VASLYKRKRSPFWWVEYVDAAGERRQESTKLRHDTPLQTRQARQLRDELTTRELAVRLPKSSGPEVWHAWVPRFIAQRYSGPTRLRYEQAWRNLDAFLRERAITVPRQLTRQDVREFIEWRRIANREFGVRAGKKNTALLEVKFLGLVMQEAWNSKFCEGNPCAKLGIKREKPKPKPAIKIDEHRMITREIKKEPDWMRVAYKIAYWQGCRVTETRAEVDLIDLNDDVFPTRTKGKKESIAEFPLSPRLRPLIRRLKREGRTWTYELPPRCSASKMFWKFFRRIGLGHLCFHCTRTTFITRCKERGIPREDVMRLAGHASTAAHEIYPRVSARSRYLQELAHRAAA
jgi:integrase